MFAPDTSKLAAQVVLSGIGQKFSDLHVAMTEMGIAIATENEKGEVIDALADIARDLQQFYFWFMGVRDGDELVNKVAERGIASLEQLLSSITTTEG